MAIVVTIASFAVCTWIAGAAVLPKLIRDHADRWVIAAGCGVALAALAGLWGYRFATAEAEDAPDDGGSPQSTATASGERSISIGGDQRGIASTGDNTVNLQGREEKD